MLRVEVRYTLVGGELKIEYAAMSDKKTAINLTNHAYFNLDGAGSGNVLDTFLQIAASRYTPTDETLIPHGEFKDVAGTPFDFRRPHRIGERIGDTDDQDIVYQGGYDVNYVFDKKQGAFEKVCEAESERSGIVMEVFTDKPRRAALHGQRAGAAGQGRLLQPQLRVLSRDAVHSNGVNVPAYAALGDAIYERNKVYHFTTVYNSACGKRRLFSGVPRKSRGRFGSEIHDRVRPARVGALCAQTCGNFQGGRGGRARSARRHL